MGGQTDDPHLRVLRPSSSKQRTWLGIPPLGRQRTKGHTLEPGFKYIVILNKEKEIELIVTALLKILLRD